MTVEHSSIFWTGSSSSDGRLKPEEEMTTTVYCTFSQPGLYDLNKWKLSVQIDENLIFGKEHSVKTDIGQGAYVQTPNLSQLITIQKK
jgi:hypothetical protein